MKPYDRLWINAHLATMDPAISAPYGALKDHALAVCEGKIAAILPMQALPAELPAKEIIDVGGRWITPGLIDCHTHLIFGGSRAEEIARRWAGASYEEIARQGGGIMATVRATRVLDQQQLTLLALPRLQTLLAEGVTMVEIKSGYGLTLDDELKLLQAARQLAALAPVNICTTLLAAHALPPEYQGRADEYVDYVCREIIPAVAERQLADAVDVFCERIAFSPEQCVRIFQAARKYSLPAKGHVEQLSNFGGGKSAARFQPLSLDHLEYLDGEGVEALARCGAVAVLLPGPYYFLRQQQKPPIEALRAANVPLAVGSDFNPGTCPICSLRLMLNMACTLFGLSAEEALRGATRHAAQALGLANRVGVLAVGRDADFLVWDIEHPAEIVCEFGVPRLKQRVFHGEITAVSQEGYLSPK